MKVAKSARVMPAKALAKASAKTPVKAPAKSPAKAAARGAAVRHVASKRGTT
ncbi:MAG: transcriptional regulator, partial [Candidatus Eisenbacteria bacterium]|nr:transcriptional regulator [Candidatus Eisenbacteria bacterium]